MRKFLLTLLIIISVGLGSFLKAQVSECDFYSNAIIKFPYDKYFISIPAHFKGKNVRIITERNYIKKMLHNAGKPTNDKVILSILNNKTPVDLSGSDIQNIIIVEPIDRLDSIFNQGKEFTLKTFFNEQGGQESNFTLNDQEDAYLIDRLCRWCIFIYRDDETGFLTLENSNWLAEYFNSPRYKEDVKKFKK